MKECPFCNESGFLNFIWESKQVAVQCQICGARGPIALKETYAESKWSHRPHNQPLKSDTKVECPKTRSGKHEYFQGFCLSCGKHFGAA